ncbi:membrane metallo-endopeptidase-like 1 [Ruditapes philippinarum]|uniref:membrane metallo-endopeptidase-like 1 n=1 Tax=Ruditapes philippinarum TaxID=129788 RepID=UPI00295ACA76|nr:membrane metallo-endopeptidase-like 1 [Ruditapes philippinarum]
MDVGHENKGYDKKDVEQGDLDLNTARANQVKLSFKKDGPIKRRTKCEKALIFFLVIFILVVIALVVVVLVQKNKIDDDKSVKNDVTATKEPEICQTADCAQASARLIASMDLSVDPCEDFYEFSCGLWRKKTVIPEASSFYGTLSEAYDDIQVTNKYLLEDMTSYQGIPAITKAKDMYTSCVNVDRIEEKGSSVAIPLLEELGGWPILGTGPGGNWSENEFSLSKLLISLHQYNNFPVIGMFVGYDDRESNKNIIHLDQPSLGLPGRLYYLQENLSEMREAYVTFASSVAQLFGADQTASERDVQDILALETDIANISTSMEDRRDTTALYNKMSISELRENFTEPTSNDVIQFNWFEYLSGVFDLENVKIAINESEPVVIYDVAYYRKLFSVLQKHGKRTLANYIVWTIMQNRVGNLDSRFQDLKTEFSKVLSGTTTQEARWKTCVSYTETYFGMALGHMFVNETFDETARAEALEMIGNIRGTFNDELENIAWMDDATRTVAKEKADAVKEWIGYPSDILIPEKLNKLYENASIDGDEYFKNVLNNLKGVAAHSLRQLRKKFNKNEWTDPPSQVNAFYSAVRNTISKYRFLYSKFSI